MNATDWFYPSLFEMPPSATSPAAKPPREKRGRFDGDLRGYMLCFVKKKLSLPFLPLADDIVQEASLAIVTQPNLRRQLNGYLSRNEIPRGRDLSLLKAVLYRQRLKWVNSEKRREAKLMEFKDALLFDY